MQYLTATTNYNLSKAAEVHLGNLVQVKDNEQVHLQAQKLPKPPVPESPPPQLQPLSMPSARPEIEAMTVNAVPTQNKIALNTNGFGLTPADGDYLPLVKIRPRYPEYALGRGIEGYVIVEFTVTRKGTTRNVRVVEANPPDIFDKAAIQAATKFEYKPRVVGGSPIEVKGVRNKIVFKFED
jgi:protein TonB